MPAAAVRQRWQALFGITGLKGRVGGGDKSEVESYSLTIELPLETVLLESDEGMAEFQV